MRLALTIFDKGERPVRLRALMADAEAAVEGAGGNVCGWRVVSMRHSRSRTLRQPGGWIAVIAFRTRMLEL